MKNWSVIFVESKNQVDNYFVKRYFYQELTKGINEKLASQNNIEGMISCSKELEKYNHILVDIQNEQKSINYLLNILPKQYSKQLYRYYYKLYSL